MESLESCFEDFGEAALVNGKAQVKFDPQFASLVNTKGYHVFLRLYSDCNGLYVSVRSTTRFSVREQQRGAQYWLFLSDRSRPTCSCPRKWWLSIA
jgi:hypothetical protein